MGGLAAAANSRRAGGAALRRLIFDEPVSRAAVWSQRLAVFALLVAGVAVLLARVHAADPAAALTVFAAALIVAGFALMLAVAAASVIWRDGLRGAGRAFLGFVLAAGLIAYPAYLAALAFALPKINDVSTDLASPPAFLRRPGPRRRASARAAASRRRRERAAARTPTPTFRRSRSRWTRSRPIVCRFRSPTDLGWRIVDLLPPSPAGGGSGDIEAVDRSRCLRLSERHRDPRPSRRDLDRDRRARGFAGRPARFRRLARSASANSSPGSRKRRSSVSAGSGDWRGKAAEAGVQTRRNRVSPSAGCATTCPRSRRSSRWARVDRPAARASFGSRPT